MGVDFSGITRVLFQGDSITDCGRSEDGKILGTGYVGMIAKELLAKYPHLEITNKGVSGNRAVDLVNRLDADFIAHKPELLSIMIGINDTWRAMDQNMPTSAEEYENNYRAILERCKDELGCKIVMIEPFLLPMPEDRLTWRGDLNPKIAAAKRLADEFADVYIPMDSIFTDTLGEREAEYWAEDGVHPSDAGHRLIADSWLKAAR